MVWEDLYGGGEAFPHVYGPIELAAITGVAPIGCGEHGRFDHLDPGNLPGRSGP